MTKEYIIAGATEPVYVNETGTRQEILATVYLNETWVNKRFFKKKVVRTKQPQTPMPIDSNNPIAQGLSHFWGIRSGAKLLDSAGNVSGSLGTTVALNASPHGMVLKATGADNADSNASPVGGTGSASAAIGQTFSIFARIKVGATYQNNPIYASLDGGVQFRISSVMSFGATATSYAPDASTTAVDGTKFVDVGVSYDGTTVRYYLDGVADGTSTWSYSSFDQTVQHYIGGGTGNDENLSQNTEIAFVGIYKGKILSEQDFKQLAENPWQLFKPEYRTLVVAKDTAPIGGTTFNQLVSGILASTGSVVRSAAKSISGGLSKIGTVVKSVGKLASGSLSLSALLNAIKTVLVSISGSLSVSGITVKSVGKVVAGSLSNTGATVKSIGKVVAGSLSNAGATVKSVGKVVAGSLSLSAILSAIKTALVSIGGSLSFVGSPIKTVGKAVLGSLSSSGTIIKTINKVLAGTLSFIGAVGTSTSGYIQQAVGGALSFSGTSTKAITKILVGALTTSGEAVKSVRKVIVGSLSLSGILNSVRVLIRAIGGSLSMAGSTVKSVGKTVAGNLANAGTVVRSVRSNIVGSLSTSGTAIKSVGKTIAGSLSFAAIVAAALNVILYFISKITFSKRARSMTFTAAKRTITFTRKI